MRFDQKCYMNSHYMFSYAHSSSLILKTKCNINLFIKWHPHIATWVNIQYNSFGFAHNNKHLSFFLLLRQWVVITHTTTFILCLKIKLYFLTHIVFKHHKNNNWYFKNSHDGWINIHIKCWLSIFLLLIQIFRR